MSEKIRIAVDAMGGENSPKKVIDGILLHHKKSKDIFYKIFGDKNLIEKYIPKNFDKNNFDIVHTEEKIGEITTEVGTEDVNSGFYNPTGLPERYEYL